MSTPLEQNIENFLADEVKLRGGFTVKLNPKGYKGIPDRLVVLPGRIVFVELKRPKGGVLARLQGWWRDRLIGMGHDARVISNRAQVLDLLAEDA